MSQGQPAENQWEEIGDEVPQHHHQAEESHHHEHPQEHQAPEAHQWQELGDEEPRQAEAAEHTPQEEYPEEAGSHHHQPEEPSEEHHHHHEAPEHQQLRAYHEEDAQESAPAPEEWAEQEDEVPALRAHDHEEAVEPAAHAHEHHEHHEPEEEYPEEESHKEHHHHQEDSQDVQDPATHAQPAGQWDELDENPQEHQPATHHAHEVPEHQHHQQLRSYHEEEPQESAPQAQEYHERDSETPAIRAHDHEEAVEAAAHPHESHHDEHPHHHPHDEEEAQSDQPAEQWAEIGDEQPQEHHLSQEHHHSHTAPEDEHHAHHQPLRSYHEEPVQEPPQAADQWAELGDQPQEQADHPAEDAETPVETAYEEEGHQARSMPPPEQARRQLGAIVKPKSRNVKNVARWEPVEHQPREESDDEFELSTCMAPVYEGEGEAGNEDASVFKHGEPDCQGEIMSCFDEPNLLYRIIDPKEKTWAFYNDSLNYEMHVQFTFGKHSKLQPLENTTMKQNDEGQYVTEVVVYPTETEMFVQGSVNGFTSKLRAVPLSDEYHNARRGITEEQVASETAAIQQLTDSDNAEDVLQACIENGIAFVDPEFPPCQASLEAGATKPFKPLAWARPQACVAEEMAPQVRLFRSNVQPGCVDAGDLGDSWVMCSVAAVSEDPARLMGMFRHPEGKAAAQREHAVGAYRVTFNKNGWWRSVLVDSYLPVSAGKIKYAKSAVDPAEIWPAILEKAYAKLHGSYAKICSGDPLHALQDMTGFSTTRFDETLVDESNKAKIELFDDLVRGISAGYTVICNTPGSDPKSKDGKNAPLTTEYAEVGLVTGHAYTILDAKFIEKENIRIVKVRNAWGRGLEWNGDWSDDDSKWEEYPEVAETCDFQKAADGTFWMPWEAAQKYFNGGGVCFSHQPAYDYRMNSVFTNGVPSAVLEIEVTAPTWFTFVISQDDKRCQENVTEYQPVMISIAEPVDGGMYKVVMNSSANGAHPTPDKWTFLQARDISLIHKLDAGKYIVIPRNMPSDADPVPYVLGMISNKEVGSGDVTVKFKRLDASNRVFENFPKFEPELKEVEQPVQFQKRAPGEGFPLTQMAEELA